MWDVIFTSLLTRISLCIQSKLLISCSIHASTFLQYEVEVRWIHSGCKSFHPAIPSYYSKHKFRFTQIEIYIDVRTWYSSLYCSVKRSVFKIQAQNISKLLRNYQMFRMYVKSVFYQLTCLTYYTLL